MKSRLLNIIYPPSAPIFRLPYEFVSITNIIRGKNIKYVLYDWNLMVFNKLYKITRLDKIKIANSEVAFLEKFIQNSRIKKFLAKNDFINEIKIGSITFVPGIESRIDDFNLCNIDDYANLDDITLDDGDILFLASNYNQLLFAILGAKKIKSSRNKIWVLVTYTQDIAHLNWCEKYFDGIYLKVDKFLTENYSESNNLITNDNSNFDFNIDKYLLISPIFPIRMSDFCYYGKCKFCDKGNYSNKIKMPDIDAIFLVMIRLYNEFKIRNFKFMDESLFPKSILSLSKMLIKNKININWQGNVRFDPAFLEKSNIELLKAAGCRKLFIGLESGSQGLLNIMGKGISLINVQKIIANLYSAGIELKVSLLFNFPGEKIEDVFKTIKFIKNNEELIYKLEINKFMLHKNSYVYKNPEEFNIEIATNDNSYFVNYSDYNIADKDYMVKQMIINDFIQYLISKNKLESDWENNYKLWS